MVQTSSDYQPVPKSKRFANYLIDILIYFVVMLVVGFVMGIFFAIVGNIGFLDTSGFELLANFLGFIILFLYYFLFELFFQATPGKFITNTRVKARSGVELDAQRIALRSIIRLVPFEPFSFLFGEGWHDKWSKTVVVENAS
ncbi:MAG: RDD family protein [Cyanobacteria bacterium J06626_23]